MTDSEYRTWTRPCVALPPLHAAAHAVWCPVEGQGEGGGEAVARTTLMTPPAGGRAAGPAAPGGPAAERGQTTRHWKGEKRTNVSYVASFFRAVTTRE